MLWAYRDDARVQSQLPRSRCEDWDESLAYLLDETKAEQLKEEFASYKDITPETWDMVRLALNKMQDIRGSH